MSATRNCAQCYYMPGCKKWQSLAYARECPDYSRGENQSARKAIADIKQLLNTTNEVNKP